MANQGFGEIYQNEILAHAGAPRHYGLSSDASVVTQGRSLLCGDEVRLGVSWGDDGTLSLSFESEGCAICKASASIMCEELTGNLPQEAQKHGVALKIALDIKTPIADGSGLSAGIAALRAVRHFPVRIKCVLLPWEVLAEALAKGPDGGQSFVKCRE